jgi:hypothetical protein
VSQLLIVFAQSAGSDFWPVALYWLLMLVIIPAILTIWRWYTGG